MPRTLAALGTAVLLVGCGGAGIQRISPASGISDFIVLADGVHTLDGPSGNIIPIVTTADLHRGVSTSEPPVAPALPGESPPAAEPAPAPRAPSGP